MPSIGLWDNFVGPPGTQATGSFSYEFGLAFVCSATVHVTGIKWYYPGGGATQVPSNLHLWDGTSHAQILATGAPSTPASAGWQTVTLGTPVDLQVGSPYVVSVTWAASHTFAYISTLPWLSAPLTWDSTPTRTAGNNGAGNYPGATFGTSVPAVDIAATTDNVTPPSGGTVTSGDLASWLRDDADNSHKDTSALPGLPYTTKLLLEAVSDNIDQGNADIAGVKAVTDALGPVLPSWVTTLEDLATWLNDWNAGQYQALKDRLLGSSGGGGSAFYGAGGTQVAQGVEDVLGILAAPTQQQPFHWPVLTDPAWEAVDSTAFDRDLWWEVPAHLYLAHFDTWPTRDTQEVLAGNTWVRRLAWWASMKAANLGERRYVEFTDAQLADAGLFMDGLYLRGRPGTTGTVTAYLLHSV
jgi:uncharacterized protein DUF4082